MTKQTTAMLKCLRALGVVGSLSMVFAGAGQARAHTAGGTYDLVQILSDERVRETISFAEIGLIKKLGANSYQINYGQCALIASIAEECTEQPGPPSCELRVKFHPSEIPCKNP